MTEHVYTRRTVNTRLISSVFLPRYCTIVKTLIRGFWSLLFYISASIALLCLGSSSKAAVISHIAPRYSNSYFLVQTSLLWWIQRKFSDRGTAYISISFAGNLLFVGDYVSWCSGTTIFAVSSIILMWNLVKFWFTGQLLRFLRFSIVISSLKKSAL